MEIGLLRQAFEQLIDPLDLYLFGELQFRDTDHQSKSSKKKQDEQPIKLVPLDSVVQTARIVTSFARRDLTQLATFEPEGAECVTRHTMR